jgi:methylated-DNA-[protein]-cysteine S-methyltransferase
VVRPDGFPGGHSCKQPVRHLVVPTAFGPVALVWQLHCGRPKIVRVVLSRPGMPAGRAAKRFFPDSRAGTCGAVAKIADRVRAFLGGAAMRFSLEAVRLDLCSEFQRRVLVAEHGIPRGRVSTYGLIAAHLGAPAASRAVGRALATNPFPIIVPCHRAVRSGGALGGYQGGLAMKRRLLEVEGVAVSRSGRVEPRTFYYGPHAR